ncbi:DUF2399 domain-containing protein [Paenibacillus sp. SN-8-1]|uniref:DUF2399 domain-containing protein n=1 Tax=Paenibacillus sp. SN-8-1 TaxID=3435409 RepID=UPI003D9A591B
MSRYVRDLMTTIERVFAYISQYILKSGEYLDPDTPGTEASIIDVSIVKKTARTLRTVGTITLSLREFPEEDLEIPHLSLWKWTPGKRANLEENMLAFEWLNNGWIMKEMRFKRDGKTIERMQYRMGYRLFTFLQKQMDQERLDQISQLKNYQLTAGNALEDVRGLEDQGRAAYLSLIRHHISTSILWTIEELGELELFPKPWSMSKRINYLHFLLAFFLISSRKEVFDWKEIGAQYYQNIGGSKAFDANKDDFITLLEVWSGQSVEFLGMISSGAITPLYFAGHLSGQWSHYEAGPVHALTDLSIAQDQYTTDATTLWLVENRGVLTRLSAERGFLRETGSLVVCVDGHLRSSHRAFIHQLLSNTQIQQAILWSDYDKDGLLIAGEMLNSVAAYPLRLKWICHNHKVVDSWEAYQEYMKELLTVTKLEQEQILGGAQDWRQWIED